jgi:hypothetical protein
MGQDWGLAGVVLVLIFLAVIGWFNYQNWLAVESLKIDGVAADANLTAARIESSGEANSYVIEYWFIPASNSHIYKASRVVDVTTFERYRKASTVPIVYITGNPDKNDIIGFMAIATIGIGIVMFLNRM